MSRIIFRESATPSTPASGQMSLFADTNGDLAWIDDSGNLTTIVTSGASNITIPSGTNTVAVLSQPSFTSTIGVGAATASTSGAGITFPATQSASTNANTLDDYEEGTWTPVVRGTTTAGTGTYTNQTGRYTKIGRQVFVEFRVTWTGLSGAVGTMAIGGLPFNAANSGTFPGVTISQLSNLELTASNVATIQVQSNTDYCRVLQYPVGGGASATVALDTTGGDIIASATYTV